MKIRTKLALGAAVLSAVTSLMVWTFAFQAGVTAIAEQTENLVDSACRQVQDATADVAEALVDQSRLWSRDQTIIAATADGKAEKLSQRLDALLAGNPTCRSLLVMAPSGELLAATTPERSGSDAQAKDDLWPEQLTRALKENDSVKQALEGRAVAGSGLYPVPHKIISPLALWQTVTPITRNGETVGALLASHSWDSLLAQRLSHLLANLEQTGLRQAQINLLDNKGTIIASTDARLIAQPFAARQGWLSFYPATILGIEQGRLVLTVPQAPLNQAIAELKTRTLIWGLAGGSALMVGLYILAHLLVSRRLGSLLELSKRLFCTIKNSQSQPSSRGDEIQQLSCTLARANLELIDRQENMQNLLTELNSLNEELAQAESLKNEFVANMSHEIRTPMNGILGFAELLSQEDLTSAQSEYVDTILKCGTNLLTLINDVLDLACIEAGHLQLRRQRCSVVQIALQACELVQNQAQQKGLKLIWQVAEDVPQWVQLDPERVGQILVNIISNAVKFTDRGFVNLNISTARRNDRPVLRISIADSGIGIAPDKCDLVFEPFAQVDGSDHRPYGGVGLGLAICRKLVEALDGSIELRSIPAEGSEFIIWLPFEKFEPTSEQPHPTETTHQDLAPTNSKAANNPPRVLVVEDDRICGEFFKTYLSRNGYAVSIETDGNKAVERAKELKPDALILDLRLPGKNGLDILTELKSKPSTEAIPVVICSVLHCEDKALNLGALDYLRKPFTGHKLLRVVHRAVLQHRTCEILAVDDEPTVRRLYEVALARAGFKVITASGGREALELLAVHPQIGLVLLDLVMPGMSGFDVLERIRSSGRTNLPVIVVTARSMSAQEKQRLEGEVSAILYKASLTPEQLLEQIHTQLGQVLDSPALPDQQSRQDGPGLTLEEAPVTAATNTGAILIAEDVVYSRRLLEVLIERAGYRIRSCANGDQAVDLARKNHFGLIILDIQMPRTDGLEAAKLIREIPAHASTPIIALTARAMKGDIQRCLQAGCTDYLAKPVREHELLEKIGKYLLAPPTPSRSSAADSQELGRSVETALIQSQLACDPELMKVVAIYIEELPQMVTNMIEALQAGDFEALAGLAHNLKGSSGLAGFPDLASQAAQMQQAVCHKGHQDFADVLQKIIESCRMVGAKINDVGIDGLFEQGSSSRADLNEPLSP